MNLSLTFIPVQNISQILFYSSTLKYKTILIIYIFPPETSYTCLTILTHNYSRSALNNGELIESETDKYSGPSKVLTLSYNGFFKSFISLILVFLFIKQN